MKLISYTLTALAAVALFTSSCKKERNETESGVQVVKMGALLSLTGNWSSLGVTSQAAMDIALNDVNNYMKSSGSLNRFTSIVYDTKLDATLASQYMAEAGRQGCPMVLGPQSSAEAAAIKNASEANNILVVSQGSTAGSLSMAGDNLFRFCPADDVEGPAMAKAIYKDGIRALVTAARNDAGNKGLQIATGNAFTEMKGKISVTTPYSNAADVNFTALLNDIRGRVEKFQGSNKLEEIAVYVASFDECVKMFQQAAGDPVLSSVRWYGGDGTALSAALTANAAAADFAIATKYFAPAFGLPAQYAGKWQPLAEAIKARTGIAPDAFALAAYDAVWVMALSYNAFGRVKPEFTEMTKEFMAQAAAYTGATGNTKLNAAGDRAAGSYDYWGLVKEGAAYKWVVVGRSE